MSDKPSTLYPERYKRDDASPDYVRYVPQPARELGRSCDPILPAAEGTIIASIPGPRGSVYYVDQDFTLSDKSKVTYLIWTRDGWARLPQLPIILGSGWKRADSVEEALEAKSE